MEAKGLDYESHEKACFLDFYLENLSDEKVYYDCTVYRIDYLHFGRWKTVDYNVFPIGFARECNGKEEKEDRMWLPKTVVSYPGKYRVYVDSLGFLEFETFKEK